jgi:hypothetical protein
MLARAEQLLMKLKQPRAMQKAAAVGELSGCAGIWGQETRIKLANNLAS